MDQISQNNNSTNCIIYYYDQTRKMIVNLGSEKCDKYYNSSTQPSRLHNSLQMIIFDTIENDLSRVEGKAVTSKVHKYSVNSS